MSKGIVLENGLTVKDEMYAQLLARGMSQADAFDNIWPSDNRMRKTTHEKASHKAGKVAARVNEITAENSQKAGISLQKLTGMVLEDRVDARREKQYGTAVAADKLLADIYGHRRSGSAAAEGLVNSIAGLLSSLDSLQREKEAKTIDGQAEDVTGE